jgi:hypothetical protein
MRRKQVKGTILEDARNKDMGERKQVTKHKRRQRRNE